MAPLVHLYTCIYLSLPFLAFVMELPFTESTPLIDMLTGGVGEPGRPSRLLLYEGQFLT